jgi:hypothetical protein
MTSIPRVVSQTHMLQAFILSIFQEERLQTSTSSKTSNSKDILSCMPRMEVVPKWVRNLVVDSKNLLYPSVGNPPHKIYSLVLEALSSGRGCSKAFAWLR